MTGNNTSPGEKLRAVFLATLMVLSVFAAGMAFTGTAAAAGNASFSASDTTAGATPATLTGGANVGSEYAGSTFQTVRLDFTPASDFDGSFADVDDADVDIEVNGASQGATVDSISNGGATITVSMGSQMTVNADDRIDVVVSNSAFENPSTDGTYSGLVHINPSSSAGKAYGDLTIGAGSPEDGVIRHANNDTETDTFSNVTDDVLATVDYSTFNNQSLSAQHYVDGELVEEMDLVDANGNGVANATFSAGKRGTIEFYNGSQKFDTEGYTASDYEVRVINNATYANTDSVQINGEIYRWYDAESDDGILENSINVDYAIYEPGSKTSGDQIVTGDTSNGQFTEVRTFSANTSATSPPPNRVEDIDYPADGQTTPSYEVFVKADVDNNNAPTPDANTNDGNAIIPVRLNFDLTNPSSVNYGETRNVEGLLTDGDDNGVANYLIEVQNGTLADDKIGEGKTRNTTTAADGKFGFTMEFNDAGLWTYGTNVGDKTDAVDDSIRYGQIEVAGQEADVSLDTVGDVNRANFTHSYEIQVNDTDDTSLHVDQAGNPDAQGYVNVTGPFVGNQTNGGFDGTNITTGDLRAQVDADNDGNVEFFHVYTDSQGQIGFDATPAGTVGSDVTVALENDDNANPFDGTFGGAEVTDDAGDTPEYPDYVGSNSLEVVAPDDINVVEFKVQDPRTNNSADFATQIPSNPSTNYTDAINLLGPSDGGPDEMIEVLPLTIQNNSRIVDGERLGNDTYQDFDGMTAYRLKVELRDRANNVIEPGTGDGDVSEIRLEGAGVNGTVTGGDTFLDSGTPYQNVLSGPIFDGQNHYVVFRPTQADEVDETITVEVNITGTDSDTDLSEEINVSGLYVDEFDVDGESDVDAVEPNSEVNVTAVVRDAQEGDVPINNGRVRVSQNSTPLGQVDARTANVNGGEYTFNDLQIGPRGVDTDGDGIGEEASQLVFTAYQYADADDNQALEQDEVDEATVETLDLSLEQDLNVSFLPDDNNTSPYVDSAFGGQTVLTKGVEYDSLAFELTDGEGNAVNLTDGIGQKVSLNNLPLGLVNLTATDINGDLQQVGAVEFNETASNPGDGYYVIEDLANYVGGNTLVSDNNGYLNGGTGVNDGVFSFYDYGATDEGPQQYWLQITTPDLSEQTEPVATDPFTYSEGQFQVADPQINTNVTGVAGPDVNGNTWANLSHDAADSFEDVSGIETLTIGINRTYRVNATYSSFGGQAINGSNFDRSWIQYDGALSGQPTDVSFEAVRTLGNANATINGNPTVNLGNGDGEFQFDITVNNSSGTGTFVPKFTANATHNPDYGVTGIYGQDRLGPAPNSSNGPNASIVGGPDAQNPLVEVYDQSGSELPVNPSEDSNNSVLANDVTQTLRVEAFPADADDVPLRGGLKFGFDSTNPIAENIVGTTTSTNGTDQPLVTNQFTDQSYDSGQIGFLTLTPTGTGDGILQLINDNDGTGTVVQDTDANDVVFDVLRSNLQVNVSLAQDSIDAGEDVTVSLTARSTGNPVSFAGVSLVDPSGNVIAETQTDSSGTATFTVDENATDGTYSIETRPAGFQPSSAELDVAGVTGGDEITLPGASGPAQDTDGDGQYEDVNGDGAVDLFDALDFYNSADSDAVQNNPAAFDFDASGDINGLFDALALWNEIAS